MLLPSCMEFDKIMTSEIEMWIEIEDAKSTNSLQIKKWPG